MTGPYVVKVLDCHGGESVVAHYRLFYKLYQDFRDSSFGAADTTMLTWLAALCPRADGGALLQARSLRQKLTGELLVYADRCTDACGYTGEGGGGGRMAKTAALQQYSLMPNPNDGNMRLQQLRSDERPVSIKVYNVVDAIVHRSSAIFDANAATLNLSEIPAGVYYMVLRDGAGTS